eukprot:7382499-Prymnesium_polylepis.2
MESCALDVSRAAEQCGIDDETAESPGAASLRCLFVTSGRVISCDRTALINRPASGERPKNAVVVRIGYAARRRLL